MYKSYLMKGKFIVFEGIDGSGKSTQYELFHKRLRERSYDIFETHEPTDEMIGTLIRNRINSKNNLPGDVNGDDEVTPADAVIALKMAVRGEWSKEADVSGDRVVTSLDALMILMVATEAE